MNTIELSITRLYIKTTIEGSFPSSWEEVENSDVMPALANVVKHANIDAKFRSFFKMAKFDRKIDAQIMKAISPVDADAIAKAMDWLFLGTTRCLVPKFKHHFTNWIGPSDKFENCKNIEFGIADEIFNKLWENKDEKNKEDYLEQLTLCLWRPFNTNATERMNNDDDREPLISRTQIESYRKRFKGKVPDEVKMAAFLYWAGIKSYIDKLYGKWLFAKDQDSEQPMQQGLNFGWWGAWQDIAEAGLYGPLDSVHQQNFHETCLYMIKKKDEQQQMERLRRQSQEKTVQL